MLLRCVAIDDEPLSLQLVKDYIQEVPALQLVQVFEDVLLAAEFIRQQRVQLVFLNDVMGLDIARNLPGKPMIIFTTTYKKIVEGFEPDVVDYLVKPFSFEHFCKAVSKAEEYYKYKTSLQAREEYLYVYSDYKQVRIDLDRIEFIESLEDHTRIHLTEGKPVLTLMPLKKIIEKLPADRFQRVHRSYAVSVSKIKSFTTRKVVLENAEVPVSESYIEVIRKLKRSSR